MARIFRETVISWYPYTVTAHIYVYTVQLKDYLWKSYLKMGTVKVSSGNLNWVYASNTYKYYCTIGRAMSKK